jgi:hypothetical protein
MASRSPDWCSLIVENDELAGLEARLLPHLAKRGVLRSLLLSDAPGDRLPVTSTLDGTP